WPREPTPFMADFGIFFSGRSGDSNMIAGADCSSKQGVLRDAVRVLAGRGRLGEGLPGELPTGIGKGGSFGSADEAGGTRRRMDPTLARRPLRAGAIAVELAIILPLFVTIVLGGLDFARFTYTHITLGNAVRAGAAWAMLNPPSDRSDIPASWQTSVQT